MDWNARIGTLGDKDTEEKRNTRDKTINDEGIRWIEFTQSLGMEILNGNIDGDLDGEYTRDGHSCSTVIDYAATTPLVFSEINRFYVDSQIESDHHPIVIQWGESQSSAKDQAYVRNFTKQDWGKEATKKYRENLMIRPIKKDDSWCTLSGLIKQSAITTTHVVKQPQDNRRWFDQECWNLRKQVKNALKHATKNPEHRSTYREIRLKYKRMLKKKKLKDEEKYKKELESIKSHQDAWPFINRERKS